MDERLLGQLQDMNRRAGRFFFSPGATRGFRSRVHDRVYAGIEGWYFVTSERRAGQIRTYTVRHMRPNGHVDPGAMWCPSSKQAHEEAAQLAEGV